MLKLVKIKDPSIKIDFLGKFQPEDTHFIVSDIKNKSFLTAELFKKHNFLPGHCVLRANEFYKQLFQSLNQQWNIQSNAFIKALLGEFLSQQKSNQVKNLAYSQVFFDFLDLSFPFFLNHSKVFEEWFFNKNLFPQYWFDSSKKFCEILKSKDIAFESAVKALLLEQLLYTKKMKFINKKTLLDLSFSIDLCEKEIFKEISKHSELFVLCPDLYPLDWFKDKSLYQEWEKELNSVLSLDSLSQQDEIQNSKQKIGGSQLKLKKALSKKAMDSSTSFFQVESKSQWMEVKKAVTQVRQWLDRGIPLHELTLYAPNMEDYWFALKVYLEKESIPFKKSIQAKCLDFPEVQWLLSALRLHLGFLSFEDLEIFCFHKASKKTFSQFQSEHFKLLNKNKIPQFLFKEKIKDPKQKSSGFDFVKWALSFCSEDWPQKPLDVLLTALSQMNFKESLFLHSWLKLFEESLALKKIEIQEEKEGLSCLSFNAFHSNKSPYIFLLGLTESAFQSNSLIPESTAKSLLNDLGIPIAFNPAQKREKNLLWFLQSSHLKEVYLSSYLYDFQGEIQNKSLIFMDSPRLYSAKQIKLPVLLKYENQQKAESFAERLKGKTDALSLEQAFQTKAEKVFPSGKKSLSPSQIKKYRECPFKYAGEKLFYAPEKSPLERELSALEKGTSVHKLFKEVLSRHPDLKLNEEQKDRLVLEALPPDKHFSHKKQKQLTQKYLKQKLNEFLKKEQGMPPLKPIALEKELICFWNQKKGELSSKGDYAFTAYVDRIDQDQKTKNYVIRDYKTSDESPHIKTWLKEGKEDLQLIFYAQALEKGLISDCPPGKVSALFYSAYNKKFKAKGFVENKEPFSSLITEGRGFKQEPELLQLAIVKTNQSAQKIVSEMEKGNFQPKPQKEDLCKKCYYNKWCRFYV